MRRRNSKSTPTSIREDITPRIRKLADNRHRILAPFPVDPMEVWRAMYTPQEHDAILRLSVQHAGALRETTSAQITHVPYDGGLRRIIVKLPRAMFGSYPAVKYKDIPDGMKDEIGPWIPNWMTCEAETNKLMAAVEDVTKACQTFGQVLRLWPVLEGFMPERGKAALAEAKARSRYPDAVYSWEWNEQTQQNDSTMKPRFMPERFVPFEDTIAECLMLPFIEGEHIAHIGYSN